MRLHEVFDTKKREREVNSKHDHAARVPFNRLGSGAYGYAVPSKSDPHVVKKLARNYAPPGWDGYKAYIKGIVDNKIAQHNPFAPRVYKYDTYKFGNGENYKDKYNIDIERLLRMDDANEDQLKAMYYSIIETTHEFHPQESHYKIVSAIERVLTDYTYPMRRGKNKHLIEIFELCDKLKEENIQKYNTSLVYDVHSGNFMMRLTPHGPQLVITDPLS